MEFKIGDVVRMKSGGPRMTVSGEADGGALTCRWFNQDGRKFDVQHASFKPEVLEKVE